MRVINVSEDEQKVESMWVLTEPNRKDITLPLKDLTVNEDGESELNIHRDFKAINIFQGSYEATIESTETSIQIKVTNGKSKSLVEISPDSVIIKAGTIKLF